MGATNNLVLSLFHPVRSFYDNHERIGLTRAVWMGMRAMS